MAIRLGFLDSDEEVLFSTRTHAKALILPAAVLIAIAGFAGYLTSLPSGDNATVWRWIIWVVAGAMLLVLVVRPFLKWFATRYIFTNRRLITRSGVFTRRGHDIPVNRISDISFERGVIDRMFGCGTLVITNASDQGRVKLHDIPHVEQAQAHVNEQLFAVRRNHDDGT